MIGIEIQTNANTVAAQLDEVGRKQIPFASALALTRTAQAGQAALRHDMPKHFTLRSTWVQRGIQVKSARKQDWPAQAAEVGTRDEFMVMHTTGGTKTPYRARALAIPGRTARTRTSTGRTKRSMQPRALLRKPNHFVFDGDNGDAFIAKRMGDGDLHVIWLLRRQVRIKRTWPFKQVATGAAQRAYDREFGAALARAMATAR